MKIEQWAKKLFKASSLTPISPSHPCRCTSSIPAATGPSSSCSPDTSFPTTSTPTYHVKKTKNVFGLSVRNTSVSSLLNMAFSSGTKDVEAKPHRLSDTSLVTTTTETTNTGDVQDSNRAEEDEEPETTTIYYNPPTNTEHDVKNAKSKMEEEEQALQEQQLEEARKLLRRRFERLGHLPKARSSVPEIHYSHQEQALAHLLKDEIAYDTFPLGRTTGGKNSSRGRSDSLPSAFTEYWLPANGKAVQLQGKNTRPDLLNFLDLTYMPYQSVPGPHSRDREHLRQQEPHVAQRVARQADTEGSQSSRRSIETIKRLRASITSMNIVGRTSPAPSFSFSQLAHPSHELRQIDSEGSFSSIETTGRAYIQSITTKRMPCCPCNSPIASEVLRPPSTLVPPAASTVQILLRADDKPKAPCIAPSRRTLRPSDERYEQLIKVVDGLSGTVEDLSRKITMMIELTSTGSSAQSSGLQDSALRDGGRSRDRSTSCKSFSSSPLLLFCDSSDSEPATTFPNQTESSPASTSTADSSREPSMMSNHDSSVAALHLPSAPRFIRKRISASPIMASAQLHTTSNIGATSTIRLPPPPCQALPDIPIDSSMRNAPTPIHEAGPRQSTSYFSLSTSLHRLRLSTSLPDTMGSEKNSRSTGVIVTSRIEVPPPRLSQYMSPLTPSVSCSTSSSEMQLLQPLLDFQNDRHKQANLSVQRKRESSSSSSHHNLLSPESSVTSRKKTCYYETNYNCQIMNNKTQTLAVETFQGLKRPSSTLLSHSPTSPSPLELLDETTVPGSYCSSNISSFPSFSGARFFKTLSSSRMYRACHHHQLMGDDKDRMCDGEKRASARDQVESESESESESEFVGRSSSLSVMTSSSQSSTASGPPMRPTRPTHLSQDLRDLLGLIRSRLDILRLEWPQLFRRQDNDAVGKGDGDDDDVFTTMVPWALDAELQGMVARLQRELYRKREHDA